MDPNDLVGLSDEERAALETEDDDPSAKKDEPEAEEPEAEAAEPETEPAAEPAAEQPAEPEAAAEPEAEPAPTEEPDEPFVPRYIAPKVEGYDDQKAAIAKEESALRDKFREGEITVDEMLEQLAAIDSRKEALVKAKVKEEISEEAASQATAQQWQWEVNRFLRHTLKNENIDYRKDPILNSALDSMVRHLAADEKNADQPSEWFLEEAHRQIKSRFNLGAKPKEETPPKPTAKPEARKPDLRSVPPNLGDMPASSGTDDVSGGEFAYLEKLTGLELERELAKLTTEQQDRWLRSA